jgi:hypothetical protein
MSVFKLYLLLILLPNLSYLAIPFFIAGTLGLVFCLATLSNPFEEIGGKEIIFTVLSIFLGAVIAISIPTKNQIMQIYGIHYATNLNGIKNLSQNAVEFLNEELNKHIKEKNDTAN